MQGPQGYSWTPAGQEWGGGLGEGAVRLWEGGSGPSAHHLWGLGEHCNFFSGVRAEPLCKLIFMHYYAWIWSLTAINSH